MSKRILLTGATGYLGSHLAASLTAAGHNVVALKRKASSLRRLETILPRITLLDIDGLDLSVPFNRFGQIDAVIHTATSYGRNGESTSQIVETNLGLPLKLMDEAVAAKTPLFLNTDTALDKFLNAYSLSKTQFAEWGRHFARQEKIRFLNLRLEHFYGEGDDDTKFTTHVINSCLMNAPELKLTLGEQKRDFIYIEDVVAAYLLLLEKQESLHGWFVELDVGSGEAVTIREFVEMVHRLTKSGTRLDFGAIPYRKGEVMHSQANTEFMRKLGWRCLHTLEQGMKRVIEGEKR